MIACSKTSKFIEAELTKKELSKYKTMEDKKVNRELQQHLDLSKQTLETQHRIDLSMMNEKHDRLYKELESNSKTQEEKMKAEHAKAIEAKMAELENSLPLVPKPSGQLLNLKKILDKALKIKK